MSDETIITSLLRGAGFARSTIEKKGLHFICPTAKEAASGFLEGDAIYNEIKKREPVLADKIKDKLEKEFAGKFGAAPMVAPMSALVCEAWK